MHKDTYCVLPFNHLSIDPVGQVRPCCNYNQHHKAFPKDQWQFLNVQDGHSIAELLNGKAHTELRKDITENKKHTFCDRCWVVEQGGGHSYRQDWNNAFIDSQNREFLDTVNVEYLEMTLGNKCNIQCRMCNPWSSSLWLEDIKKNPELNYWNAEVDNLNFEWYNTPEFDKLLDEIIPTIKHLNMLGGEPLFNQKYYEILQRIVDSGRSHEVSLQFNTNLLALQDKNFDLWKNFKTVSANISCDGVEKVNEYVRYPGKWDKFLRNLDKIINWQRELGGNDKLILQIHSTMSSLTWLNFGQLLDWCQTLPIVYKFPFVIQVNQPSYMDCIHMPYEIKQKGYNDIMQSIKGKNDWQVTNIKSLADYVISTERDIDQWETMIVETNKLDKVRNSNIFDYVPEFRDYWQNVEISS